MADDLLSLVEQEVTNNTSPEDIKQKMLDEGFLESEIDEALRKKLDKFDDSRRKEEKKMSHLFTKKEIFDRIGYGFVPHQFINILFRITGASYLWLGLVNGARTIISIITSSLFQEYSKENHVSKDAISKSGYLFGFSFFGLAIATLMKSVPMFAIFLLLGGIGVVTHGDLYKRLLNSYLSKEKRSKFLAEISSFGVLITAVSMLVSGWILDKFPATGSETITFMGSSYPVYGYLISFEVTAIAFVLSGGFLAYVEEQKMEKEGVENFLKDYWKQVKIYLSTFMSHKHLFLLIMTGVILGFAQVLGNSYYGVFIYEEFGDMALGGFMNVAVIYFVAIIASLIGPWFSKKINKKTGLAPTLVFGTLLVALMPLAMAYNPNLYAIGAANALSVIGASILGVSQGMLARKLLRDDERKVYFSVTSMAGVLPFLILIPLGSWYAQTSGLVPLFKVLAFTLALVVAPLYIILVVMGRDKRL